MFVICPWHEMKYQSVLLKPVTDVVSQVINYYIYLDICLFIYIYIDIHVNVRATSIQICVCYPSLPPLDARRCFWLIRWSWHPDLTFSKLRSPQLLDNLKCLRAVGLGPGMVAKYKLYTIGHVEVVHPSSTGSMNCWCWLLNPSCFVLMRGYVMNKYWAGGTLQRERKLLAWETSPVSKGNEESQAGTESPVEQTITLQAADWTSWLRQIQIKGCHWLVLISFLQEVRLWRWLYMVVFCCLFDIWLLDGSFFNLKVFGSLQKVFVA